MVRPKGFWGQEEDEEVSSVSIWPTLIIRAAVAAVSIRTAWILLDESSAAAIVMAIMANIVTMANIIDTTELIVVNS